LLQEERDRLYGGTDNVLLPYSGHDYSGSTYWNMAFGNEKGEVDKDEEGLGTAQDFSKKMVWIIKNSKTSNRLN